MLTPVGNKSLVHTLAHTTLYTTTIIFL